MGAREDRERQERISADPLARLIHDEIEKLPHAKRLYPDLYSEDLARVMRDYFDQVGQ